MPWICGRLVVASSRTAGVQFSYFWLMGFDTGATSQPPNHLHVELN